MRYIVTSTMGLAQIEAECRKVAAGNVRVARLLEQVFCELDDDQVKALAGRGLKVKPVKEHRADQVVAMQEVPGVETLADVFYLVRSYFTPPLSGVGLTVAVLDSGIRKSHESLQYKVVHEVNFTDSDTASDVYGHGTGVAYLIAGGQHMAGAEAGVSPGAILMNIKVLNDEGLGTDESVIMGIEEVCELAQAARVAGLLPTDDMYPNVINLSLGSEDDGDVDNPVRVACRQASVEYGLDVVAAAGNSGPDMSTISLPACEPEVIAVGAIETIGGIVAWEKSSRGPTLEGSTKPDFVLWGTDITVASKAADDEYVTKSGTSFSAPILSGLTGLVWESGRRAYGAGWPFRWAIAREFAPYFCVKPPDAAVKKDNTFGYGVPAMGTMVGEMSQPAAPMEEMMVSMTTMMAMVMMVGMLGRAL
ncbi:MAG: S8 family serine peptidase [Chloroflexota bacterium]|nr:S8 family serine peptidase [Chloroflexota bacterium]